jgi:hypothetical protein
MMTGTVLHAILSTAGHLDPEQCAAMFARVPREFLLLVRRLEVLAGQVLKGRLDSLYAACEGMSDREAGIWFLDYCLKLDHLAWVPLDVVLLRAHRTYTDSLDLLPPSVN